MKASYVHLVNPVGGHAVAAEVAHKLNTSDDSFTIGSSHSLGVKLDPATMVRLQYSVSTNGGQNLWQPCQLSTTPGQ